MSRRLVALAAVCSASALLAVAADTAAGVDFRMYGPTWDIAPLSTPTWSFDCRARDGGAWSAGFIVRRNWQSGQAWGYSYHENAHAPNPFTWSGFPYKASLNPGHIPTGYIMVTNWSFERHNYTNIAVCEKPAGGADARAAAVAGTVSGKEEDGTPFVYSTRVNSEREQGGTRHLFVTRPLLAHGTTELRLSCSRGLRIIRAFSHVGFYTSRALDDAGEESENVRESRATLDERVSLHDLHGKTNVVGLARGHRAILYEDIYCASP